MTILVELADEKYWHIDITVMVILKYEDSKGMKLGPGKRPEGHKEPWPNKFPKIILTF